MPVVRQATREDVSAIVNFQKKMAKETEHLELNEKIVEEGVNAVFTDKSRGKYFIAEDNYKIIASLLITYEWSDWRNSNIWWIQSVYVIPEYRRKGIFREMYTFIKALGEKQDIAGLRLYVETNNTQAKMTYEALGMNSGHYSFYEWMRK
ncbi:MAG: GNAT family N-acetyltransferase [Bacteroidetes bacterium]|jgi:ribosomal protein S18 acetylase RimI-like enzyme|nr:GNAT family N-acetyltransferase [Bacteroidota bacterium]